MMAISKIKYDLAFFVGILALLIQIAPIVYYPFLKSDSKVLVAVFESRFEQCVDHEAKSLFNYYVKNKILINGKAPDLKIAENKLNKKRIENCRIKALNESIIDYDLFFVFLLFLILPLSGLVTRMVSVLKSMTIYNHQSVYKAHDFKFLIKFFVLVFSCFAVVSIGLLIVWGFCLPDTILPKAIQTWSLVLGGPFLGVIFVSIHALGRTYASSGQRVHESIIEQFTGEKEDKD